MKAWPLAHEAREARSKDRHGEPAAEQGEKKRGLVLREIEMWYGYRDKRKLDLTQEEETTIFHNEFDEHKREEGTLSKVKNWISNWGTILKESMIRAAMARRQERNG